MAPTGALVTAGSAIAAYKLGPMVRSAIPGTYGVIGEALLGGALVYGGFRVADGVAAGALVGAGAGLLADAALTFAGR